MTSFSFRRLTGLLALALFALPAMAQSPVGQWRTIDDETGEPKSIVRIFEEGGEMHGEIVKLLPEGRRCEDCAGSFNNSTLRGTRILTGLERDGDEYNGGTITDPKTGKVYKVKMKVQRDGRLYLRGYIGIPALGRTQYWERVSR